MRLNRERIFSVVWRLALLSLPWQTRWFSDVSLGGWPWEQGRLSVYVSFGFLLGTIGLGWRMGLRCLTDPVRRIFAAGVILLMGLSFIRWFMTDWDRDLGRAMLQWWFQIGILIFFFLTLWRAFISGGSVARWVVYSLFPGVILGALQWASQVVWPSTWLGIASHLPSALGTAVIEGGGVRVLRVYGPFPHPNIFGAWLAVGMILSIKLGSAVSRWRVFFWSGCASLFAAILTLTFSRSAWLAAACGFLVLGVQEFRRKPWSKGSLTGRWMVFVLPVFVAFSFGVAYKNLVMIRTDVSQRLEVKSINTRQQSLRDGWRTFLRHPWIGAGVNGELLDVSNQYLGLPWYPEFARRPFFPQPLEPPHNVFLLMLVDSGVIGTAIILFVFFSVFRLGSFPRFSLTPAAACLIFIFSSLDHYGWSTWSGQCVFALLVFFLFVDFEDDKRDTRRLAEGSKG